MGSNDGQPVLVIPSSSGSLQIWNQGVDRYLIYWLAWEPKVPNIKGTGR